MVSARPTLTGERKISIFFPRRRVGRVWFLYPIFSLCAQFVYKHGHIESDLKIPIIFKPLSPAARLINIHCRSLGLLHLYSMYSPTLRQEQGPRGERAPVEEVVGVAAPETDEAEDDVEGDGGR